MVGDARFVNAKLLTRKLGGTETNIALNTFVNFASPKYGLKYKSNISARMVRELSVLLYVCFQSKKKLYIHLDNMILGD